MSGDNSAAKSMLVAGCLFAASPACQSQELEPTPPAGRCDAAPVTATQANSVSASGEDVDTTCVSVAGTLKWKSGAAGSPCASPLDCAPVCCPCSDGSHYALSTWCDQGTCAPPNTVCCMVLGTTLRACGG